MTWTSNIYIPFTLKWHYCHVRFIETQHNFEITYLHLNLLQVQKEPPEVFHKKAVLKNFAIFTGKHLRWSLFSMKLQAFTATILLKRHSNTGVFLWTLQNFQEQLFWRTSGNGCFCSLSLLFSSEKSLSSLKAHSKVWGNFRQLKAL